MTKDKKNDLTVKIFALIFAVILWSYVMNEVNPPMSKEIKNINVIYSNLDQLDRYGLVLMEPKEVKVNVRVSGRRSDVLKVSEDDIVVKADLSGYSEGINKVPIYIVDVPSKVEVVDYSPKEVSVKFESIVSKEKPVVFKTMGELPSGYSLGEAEIKPQSVFLKGPKSWVNSVSEVLAVVDVNERTSDINVTIPIKLVDDQGNDIRGVEKDPNVVDIFVPVYKTKTVPIEATVEGEIPSEYEVTNLNVVPSTIEIKGYEEDINNVVSIKTKPIDVNKLLQNESLQVDLELPEGVELVNSNQKIIVKLKLEKVTTKTFEYRFSDIYLKSLGEDFIVENKESIPNITVTLKGPETILYSTTKESLSPEIDLYGLDAGTYDIGLNIKVPEGVSIESVVPLNIRVVLKKELKE